MKNVFKMIVVASFIFLLIGLPAHTDSSPILKYSLPKVVIVATGGTVAMKYDPVSKGAVPALTGKDLIEAVPGLDKIAEIETVEFCNIDGSLIRYAVDHGARGLVIDGAGNVND